MPKTKSRRDQPGADVDLATIWSDPPVEELGSPVRTISNKDYLRELPPPGRAGQAPGVDQARRA